MCADNWKDNILGDLALISKIEVNFSRIHY